MQATGIKADFVETGSLLDFVRLSCRSENSFCYAMGSGKQYRLLYPGEKVGKNTIMFFHDVPSLSRYGIYSRFDKESFTMVGEPRSSDLQSYRMHIVAIDGNPFGKPDPKSEMNLMKISNYQDLVKGQVYRSIAEESAQVIYVMDYKGKRVAGAIAPVDHDLQIFMYSELPEGKDASFFRYAYMQDRVTMEQSVERNTDFYLPIINLKGKFSFLK